MSEYNFDDNNEELFTDPKPNLNIRTYPEAKIQEAGVKFLELRGWYVKIIPGNATISGLPDTYCFHPVYRQRWVEYKNPLKYSFTKQQIINFPKMSSFGIGIWILTAATEEEYKKLWLTPNWHEFLKINRVRTRKVKDKPHDYIPRFPIKDKNK